MKHVLAVYTLIAIVTFGRPYNNLMGSCQDTSYMQCNVTIIAGSLLAAAFWPLYISVSFWDE